MKKSKAIVPDAGFFKNIHMKKCLFSFLFIVFTITAFSQNSFIVHSNDKGMYLTHTVQPKENFYSIGRLYSTPPKEIAAFNALDMGAGLSVGQTVQIPLTAANFSQTKNSGAPVYYVVGEKEGLYRVSTKNGKVLMADLRKWNNLTSDNLSTGQKLIVGFLQSGETGNAAPVAKSETTPPPVVKEPEPKKEQPQQQAPQKPAPTAEVKTTPAASKQTVVTSGSGYFKNQFDLQSKEHKAGLDATVTSGIFKTSSGWQDGKYYALMDKVEPGTIVQIINPANNRSVYAKVLGEMSGIRQNQGLELRISNAAATALDIAEPDKFIVRVVY
jgi:LysM repeat protein